MEIYYIVTWSSVLSMFGLGPDSYWYWVIASALLYVCEYIYIGVCVIMIGPLISDIYDK